MAHQKLLALDLESNQPSGLIIQIGACVGDPATKQILESFSAIVDPGEPITQYITDLTGITQQRVNEEGTSLQEAGAKLFAFVARHKPFGNPVVWGNGDAESLRKQLGLEGVQWVFGHRSVDVKTLHVAMCLARGRNPRAGLSKAMKLHYDMDFVGRAHDAQCDAENTMRLFFRMQDLYFKA